MCLTIPSIKEVVKKKIILKISSESFQHLQKNHLPVFVKDKQHISCIQIPLMGEYSKKKISSLAEDDSHNNNCYIFVKASIGDSSNVPKWRLSNL